MKRTILMVGVVVFWGGTAFGILPGPIQDFFTPRPGDTTAIVFGTEGLRPIQLKAIEFLAYKNADYLNQKDPLRVVQVYADTAFPPELFSRRSLVLMGSPGGNQVLAEWKGFFPFMQRDNRFNISGRKLYKGEDATLSCIFPNPAGTDRYVLLLVGLSSLSLPSLADWEGDYDFYVAQRHTFPGRFLCRGKFEKSSSLWSSELTAFERSPGDTASLFSLVYPFGQVWYPAHWEEDSLWANPLAERIRMLAVMRDLISVFERGLGFRVRNRIDFELSERYPEPSAYDPMGRVFLRTHPHQMDSSFFLAWGAPLCRALFACSDAPLDWELFTHRYLLAESFVRLGHLPPESKTFKTRGRQVLEALSLGDTTYLSLLLRMAERRLHRKIGEILDSVTEQGKRYTFKMRDFIAVLERMVSDTAVLNRARLPLKPSPYDRAPAYDLGVEDLREWFLKEVVEVGELEPDSKAAAAGLRQGDKILSVDGLPTNRNRSRAYLAWVEKKKGESMKLVIERKGVKRTLVVPMG
ncbi:MAG: PDZ domain-containing protein [candidate division Zixibacteria bacterium]|nr:PDZ domain-containing protein [candidate division Zixibacteria bacterium]